MVRLSFPHFFFSSFASSLKNAVLKNNTSFIVHYSNINYLICEYFFLNNFFSEIYYLCFNDEVVFIFIVMNTFEGGLIFYNITFFYNKSFNLVLKCDDVKNRLFKYKSMFLLSTSKGILNSFEAINLGVGGVVLFGYY